jgi:hypothetical protein
MREEFQDFLFGHRARVQTMIVGSYHTLAEDTFAARVIFNFPERINLAILFANPQALCDGRTDCSISPVFLCEIRRWSKEHLNNGAGQSKEKLLAEKQFQFSPTILKYTKLRILRN